MGKEKKIGLSFIASLLVILGVLIVRRLMGTGETPTAHIADPAATTSEDKTQPNLFNSPTLLETKSGSSRPGGETTTSRSRQWESSRHATRNEANRDDADARTSFMPPAPQSRQVSGATDVPPDANSAAEVQSDEVTRYDDRYALPEPGPAQTADDSTAADDSATELPVDVEDAAEPVSADEDSAATTSQPAATEAPDRFVAPGRAVQVAGKSELAAAEANASRYAQPGAPASVAARPASTPLAIQHGNVAHLTPARAPTAPTRANTGKYAVEPGDSFWQIAVKVYGDGGYFKALQEHNRGRLPNAAKLKVGDEILTPPVDALHEKYSGLCPKARKAKPGTPQISPVALQNLRSGKNYVVEDGDTLYDIARFELGDAKRWPEIYQLNHAILGEDIDFLRPGTRLALPATGDDGGDTLTRQPGDMLRR